MQSFDTIVIGSGPGGYVAAIKSAQLGAKVAIVEKYTALGGVCLNVGCIPSKALLDTSEKYNQASKHFSEHGILIKDLSLDFSKIMARKEKVVKSNTDGISFLMKKNKITVFNGIASFVSENSIKIDNKEELQAKNFIIATGSKPASLPGIEIDKKTVISSSQALALPQLPKSLLVIGGGVIGIELGSVYARLGVEVSIVEFQPKILPNFDSGVSKEMLRILEKQNLKFYLSHQVQKVEKTKTGCKLTAIDQNKASVELSADLCLMAVGRKPYTAGLNLDKINLKLDAKGFIVVNDKLQTSLNHIYAIGDVIGGAMLAHKAEEEAVFVSEIIAGQQPKLDHNIPSVVYTSPEVAFIGLTEDECINKNISYNKGQYPISALGRARASGETNGFVKILSNKATDTIIGAHIIGSHASELIAELSVAMSYKAAAEDIARITHPHPSFSEAIKEAATQAWIGKSINL